MSDLETEARAAAAAAKREYPDRKGGETPTTQVHKQLSRAAFIRGAEWDAKQPLPPLTDEEVRAGAEALAEHDNPGVYERGEVVARWDDYLAASRAMLEAVRAIRQNSRRFDRTCPKTGAS